jgi:hypothetical protein
VKRLVPILLCALVTTHGSAVQAQALDAQQVLAKAKQAAGGEAWDKVRSLYSKGKSNVYGVDADREVWVDLQRLRFAEKLKYLAISGGLGFDGKAAWGKDVNKPLVTETSGDFYKSQITSTVLRSYAYWFPKRWEAKTEYKGQKQDEGKQFQVVQISPKEGSPFELWFDSSTYLMARIKGAEPKAIPTYVSDYRDVQGVKLPFSITTKTGANDANIKIEEIQVNKLVTNEQYQPPAEFTKGAKSNKKG